MSSEFTEEELVLLIKSKEDNFVIQIDLRKHVKLYISIFVNQNCKV